MLPFEPFFNKQKQVAVSDDIIDDLEHTKPEYVTYDIQVMDVDPAENGADAAMPIPTETIPMTMQELAEAAAEKQSAEQDTNVVKGNSITSNAVGNQSVRTLHSQKSSRQSTPLKAAKTRRGVAPATKGRGATKSRTAMDRNRSARKRRQSSEDGESQVDSESSHGESDHDDDDDPPPKKRRRAPASSSAKPAPSPPTRVLRPRRSKTQAQVEADQAQEEAFRRAAVV